MNIHTVIDETGDSVCVEVGLDWTVGSVKTAACAELDVPAAEYELHCAAEALPDDIFISDTMLAEGDTVTLHRCCAVLPGLCLNPPSDVTHTASVAALALSPCGERIAVLYTNTVLAVWDTTVRISSPAVLEGIVCGIGFSRDLKFIYAGTSNGLKKISIDGECANTVLMEEYVQGLVVTAGVVVAVSLPEVWVFEDDVLAVRFSPGGKGFAVSDDSSLFGCHEGTFVRLYDMRSGEEKKVIDVGGKVRHMAISSCSEMVAASVQASVRVFAASDGSKTHTICISSPVGRILFAPCGTMLLYKAVTDWVKCSLATGTLLSLCRSDEDHLAITPSAKVVFHSWYRQVRSRAL